MIDKSENSLQLKVLLIGLGQATGGPVKSMIQLVEHLNKQDFRIFILTFPNPHKESLIALQKIDNVQILPVKIWINSWLKSTQDKTKQPLWNRIKAPGRILRTLYNAVVISRIIRTLKIDLVHTNIELIADGAIGAFLARRKHIWHIRARIGSKGVVTHALGSRFACFIINFFSSAIIVNSIDTKKTIEKNIPADKIHLVYNGITPELFIKNTTKSVLREPNKIPASTIIVAAIGYVSYIKGAIEFIEVAKRVIDRKPEIKFIYIGPSFDGGDEDCMNDSNNLIKKYHLEKSIIFTGYRADITSFLNEIDILVQPMVNGSWSRVVLEAMATGKPVVAIEESLKSEFLEQNITGLLAPDVDSCSENIIKLIDDPKLRERLGEAGQDFVTKNYSNATTALKIEEIYKQLIK